MTEVGGGKGGIELYFDSKQNDDPIALTAVDGTRHLGDFRVVGQGMAEIDSGAVHNGATGGAQFRTTDQDVHSYGIESGVMFDLGLQGTITAEDRVNLANNTTKKIFMGFTDIAIGSNVPDVQTDLILGTTETYTLTASDICGFSLDSELTAATAWHGVFKGGATTGDTVSTNLNLTPVQTDGEWQVLRLEMDGNGTARWFIDGHLKKTQVGAVSTTVDLKFFLAIGASANTIATLDVDYVIVKSNRDWTR